MSDGSVLWAEPFEEEGDGTPETEAHSAAVDETFAKRRLRRWLKGMFGGEPESEAREPLDDPDS